LTDWLDGYLARKWGVVTVLGKFLDPLADKLIVMAALIMLIPLDRVPAWAVFIILARDIIIVRYPLHCFLRRDRYRCQPPG
jgi:CDP-diacylglycerol---glycerol-3-phosphate 3-phosphatidyltransferase